MLTVHYTSRPRLNGVLCISRVPACGNPHGIYSVLFSSLFNNYLPVLCNLVTVRSCSLFTIVVCVCRVVFSMWLLHLYCYVFVVLLALVVGLEFGWWVWCDSSERDREKVWGRGVGWWGFSRESKILLGNVVCSSFRWLFLVNSA